MKGFIAALLALQLLGCMRVVDGVRLQQQADEITNLKRQNDNLRRNCPRDV